MRPATLMRLSLLAVLLALNVGCPSAGPPTSDEHLRHIEHRQLIDMLAESTEKNPVVLVDVRSPEDFEQEHLPGAINIPLGDLSARDPRLAQANTVIVYHQRYKGNFADMAAKKVLSEGLTNVFSYAGGYEDWKSRQADPAAKDAPPDTPPVK